MRNLWKKFTDAIEAFIMKIKASAAGGGGKPDKTPDAFAFSAVTDAELSTEYISNEITVSGINASVAVSVTSGSYQKNGGAWATAGGTAVNGDRFRVKRTSAAVNSVGASVALTVGGVTGNYLITTKAAVVLPPPGSDVELPNIPSEFDVNSHLVPSFPCGDYGASTFGGDEGALRFECKHSHLGWNDPIVYPGQAGASHLHNFFGNTLVDHNSTYESLRTSGDSTCAGGPINRSAYWFPAMIRPQNNMVVRPDFLTVYYKMIRRDQRSFTSPNPAFGTQHACRTLPRGLRGVYGWSHANEAQPFGVWGCEDNTTPRNFSLPGTAQGTLADVALTGCPPGQRLLARINSPSCWDGINLDSADHRSHLAHEVQDGYGNAMCPPTHPVPIPRLANIFWFSHNGPADFSQWYLDSDRHGGENFPGGHTFHTDVFWAWDTTISDLWAKENLGVGGGQPNVRSGVGGQICDGRNLALDESFISLASTPEPDRYLEIPPHP